jgi:uncharacterized coiled-coil DUF342 family protein
MTERSSYIQKLHEQLDAWDAELQKMRAEAEKASADASKQYHEQIASLRAQQDQLKQRLEDMRRAGEESWTDYLQRTEAAWKDMAEGMQRAWNRFR